MGRVNGEDLEQLIAHCYASIHPSHDPEGLSIVILEAMSYGRLVVMSDIPANRDLVDHSGLAYPVGNVKTTRYFAVDNLRSCTAMSTRRSRA